MNSNPDRIDNNVTLPTYRVKALRDFILNNRTTKNERDIIVFYGGEPLMNQTFMKDFIRDSQDDGFSYVLHTNGILLDKIDDYLLKNIHLIYISFDGVPENHNKFRGNGTFEKVIWNLENISKAFKGKTLARMTIPVVSQPLLRKAVMNCIEKFDFVFWQIENSPSVPDRKILETFKRNYFVDVDFLISYWLKKLAQGVIPGILPFNSITHSVLAGFKHNNFRCGFGTKLVVLDTDGICYACDELLGNRKFQIGDIQTGLSRDNLRLMSQLSNGSCEICDVRGLCGGRCARAMYSFPKEKTTFYCDMTRILIKKLKETAVPIISKLISKDVILLKHFENSVSTEEIP
jgi:uncharacterized protein